MNILKDVGKVKMNDLTTDLLPCLSLLFLFYLISNNIPIQYMRGVFFNLLYVSHIRYI